MDFLNKAFTQFNDLFRSMTPGGRITSGLLLIVAVVSVGYLFQSQVGGGDDYLFGGESMDTPTLQVMEAAFGKATLNGFSIDGGRVKVPHSQRALYLAALADAKAMPKNWNDKLKDDGGMAGMIMSPKQQEERILKQKEDEMSTVISSMKGIERASVLIDSRPQNSGFGLPPIMTASVAAQAIGSMPLDDDQVDKIRYYVAAACASMKPENVTISDVNGRVHPPEEVGSGGGDGAPYARAVRKAEQDLNAKVREALSYIPNLTVNSTVTLDHEKGNHSVEIKNDPKPIPLETSEDSHSMNREASSAGGSPGLSSQGGGANQPASLGAAGGKGTNETSEENKTRQVNVVSSTSTEKAKFDLTPTMAKVSVGIPSSYYEKVWKDRNPAKEGEEVKRPDQTALEPIREEITKDIRNHVATLLPIGADVKDPSTLVTVTTFQDIKSAEIQGPPVTQRALSWLGQNWPMMAMVGLVLFSLSMLRSVLRGLPSAPPESATVSMRVSDQESKSEPSKSEEPVEAAAARRLRRITGSGPSLRDELSEFVKEDPDSAANILRSWIGQVS